MPDDPPLRARARGVLRARAAVAPAVRRPGRVDRARAGGPCPALLARLRRRSRARTTRRREKKTETAEVNHPKTEIGDWTFSNWPLYIDKKVIKDFNKKYGGKCKYVEEINDNNEFYGKIRQQLENGPADRPRHHHADRLPGLPPGPAQLRRAAGQEEHPEPGQHGQQPPDDQLRPGARVLDAVAVRRDRRSATTSRRPGASSRASRTSSTRSSRAA